MTRKRILDLLSLDPITRRGIRQYLNIRRIKRRFDKQMAAFLCIDCGYQTLWDEYYSLNQDVWDRTGVSEDGGMLCIGCVEKRLGRPLHVMDFDPEAALNWNVSATSLGSKKSPRLLDRLGISPGLWALVHKNGGSLKRSGGKWEYRAP